MTRSPIAPLLAALLAATASAARADSAPAVTARAGEDVARAAAVVWSKDARLIYLENDERVGPDGRAARWGYLFYSPLREAARAYTVRESRIRGAEDLAFGFDAPPLPAEWIDSAAAIAIAEKRQGAEFRAKHAGALRTMFLARGLFHPDDPDAPTWAIVYDSPSVPGLWVIVDAATGKVVRTWRG